MAAACEQLHDQAGRDLPSRGGNVALTSARPITLTVDDDNWRDYASCRDTNPDLFFPVGTTGPAIEQIAAAKAVCAECEAQKPCLEYALSTNQDSGIWGGTSEEERRKLRRQWLAARRRAS
jgi:WhiB family redox-sensing transcriptional regulator